MSPISCLSEFRLASLERRTARPIAAAAAGDNFIFISKLTNLKEKLSISVHAY